MKRSVVPAEFRLQSEWAFSRAVAHFPRGWRCAALCVAGFAQAARIARPLRSRPLQYRVASARSPGAFADLRAPPAVERQPAIPGEYVEEGVASWYGDPVRRTPHFERRNLRHAPVHRGAPHAAVRRDGARDESSNGKQTEVRINDRGPFVANRVIDLSLAAAQAIDMVGPGTAQVRLEDFGARSAGRILRRAGGCVPDRRRMPSVAAQLAARYSPVTIVTVRFAEWNFYRVRVGRLPTEDAAQQLADQLHSDGQLTTFVVRLDE